MTPELQMFVDDETGDVTVAVKGEPGKGCIELSKHLESFFGPGGERDLTEEYNKQPKIKTDQRATLTNG